eukprot:2250239-Pleurochrysis_carterae.AAC.1
MRKLLAGARGLTSQWLAVAILREAHGDADRLSHPAKLEEVLRDARSAGLQANRRGGAVDPLTIMRLK